MPLAVGTVRQCRELLLQHRECPPVPMEVETEEPQHHAAEAEKQECGSRPRLGSECQHCQWVSVLSPMTTEGQDGSKIVIYSYS